VTLQFSSLSDFSAFFSRFVREIISIDVITARTADVNLMWHIRAPFSAKFCPINHRYLSLRGSMTPLLILVTSENITLDFSDIKKIGWNLGVTRQGRFTKCDASSERVRGNTPACTSFSCKFKNTRYIWDSTENRVSLS